MENLALFFKQFNQFYVTGPLRLLEIAGEPLLHAFM